MTDALTPRQERDLILATKHLANAMKAFQRAGVPAGQNAESWQFLVAQGERAACEASDRLIDGLEEHDRRRASDE